ncbi:Methyl-accepting chemotaxis protein [Leptospira biflexa serovar Patoc strain 'Patoc 1 (Ames)']|uniref:Putative methyl-accepting chemotaxis protein putative signal peptide n=1 Tax=Leptospira biflexa serovar Patoc (strain Patoc 1 / ATCC 23582 / Paris) TaxID=456481 RepID=B0SU42_LEPBP|nr:methyl-accepting chemotaxis protein [Leptospira biflexa]ABZ96008.1 Methyl-accepting chemotaxis protein [Leptospira biflexa serovar Patoc strain 'Patoc 1 (Ames)']ABZ99726.1 Putative methyl-accepting chemotaxis protein; putative signal peptide [Leptospira biflexa serovar Patoc strain 'Patoc 1 (Paris)']
MNIKQKLALGSSVITLLSLGVILTLISYVIYKNAKEDALEKISILADKISLDVGTYLSAPLNEAFLLKQILQEPNLLDRERVFKTLTIMSNSNESILGTYVVFEPNAFDGKDANFRNTKYHDQTGRFIPYAVKSNGKIIIEPVVGYELPESDFYQLPKKNKKVELIPPFDYKVDGTDVTMISLVYPVIQNQKFIGIAGADLSLSTIRAYLQNLKILEGSVKITLVASNGYVLFNGLNPESKNIQWVDKEDTYVNLAMSSKQKQNYVDSDYFHVSLPISLVENTAPWTLRISYPQEKITNEIQFIFWIALGLGFTGILFSTLANIIIFRKLVDSRLQNLISYAKEAASGNLLKEINDTKKDEIGNLVEAIIAMVTNIRHILSVAQSSGNELKDSSLLMENTILELSDLAQSQAASSEEASATVEELNASSETINANVEQAVSNSKSIHSSLLEIQKLVQNITSEVENFGQIAKGANLKAEEGRTMASLTSKAIEEIQDKSVSITEFSDVISNISEKTSLLALNAAIEAARAGESGRGFAVVAEEISKLASQAASSVSQINSLSEEALESIQNGGNQVSKLIALLQDIIKEVSVIFEKASDIVPLIQDQKTRTDQIYVEIEEITSLVESIQQSTEEQKRATSELSNMTINISNGSQILSDQSETMSGNSLRMTGISAKISEILQKFNL